MMKKTIVLGAGIAGLGYAWFHGEKEKEKVTVYEKNEYSGGLCRSFKVNGYTFDLAVHMTFTTDSRVRDIFDCTPYETHKTTLYNFYHGTWVKHPIIYNTQVLPIEERVDCIESFFSRDMSLKIENYNDWLNCNYGKVFNDKFYKIYTEKYWRYSPEKLSTTWLGKRLNLPNARYVLEGSYTCNEERNDYYANEFRYPKGGNGYEQFLKPLIDNADVKHNCEAVEIDLDNRYVLFSNNEKKEYDKLVSSIPLPDLVRITLNVPDDIKEAASKLKATKVSIVSVGFNKPNITNKIAFYIYDRDIMAARVSCPSVQSRDNVPEGCSSLQFEIYHRPDEIIKADKIVENVKYSLDKLKMCEKEDIEFIDYRLLPYGNVIYEVGMEENRDKIVQYYENKGVRLIGRFGKWEYLWSDQSLMSAL